MGKIDFCGDLNPLSLEFAYAQGKEDAVYQQEHHMTENPDQEIGSLKIETDEWFIQYLKGFISCWD